MRPVARRNDLIVKRDTGELFIEDVLNNAKIHLNPTSAYVWEKCDGKHEMKEIAAEMSQELGMSVSEKVILSALSRLQVAKLLQAV